MAVLTGDTHEKFDQIGRSARSSASRRRTCWSSWETRESMKRRKHKGRKMLYAISGIHGYYREFYRWLEARSPRTASCINSRGC